jgi:hypothetical protein
VVQVNCASRLRRRDPKGILLTDHEVVNENRSLRAGQCKDAWPRRAPARVKQRARARYKAQQGLGLEQGTWGK